MEVRAVDLLAALSLATDLGTGQPLEHGLRTCAAATALGEAAGMDGDALGDAYCVGLLHSIGCTSDAYEAARLYGDDVAVRAAYAAIDPSRPAELMGFLVRFAGAGRPPLERAGLFAKAVAGGPAQARRGFAAHCEVGRRLAERLGLTAGVQHALEFVFERWDGKGHPAGAAGEAIPVAARLLHVARDLVIFARTDGPDDAPAALRRRRGAYDPTLLAAVSAPVVTAATRASWDAVLASFAAPRGALAGEALDEACAAVADFADIKSWATLGHAHRVSELAEAAAWRLGLGDGEVAGVRRAALVQDLGRVAVSNAVWDRAGPLSDAEWERVRLHPYYTARALARGDLAPLGELGGAHHERLGGAGYHRGVDAAGLPVEARLLAAADAFAAMTEDRPHRPALAAEAAAGELRGDRLDPDACEAVLAAAGQRAHPVRRELPAGLSEREAEVLALIARGHANKAVALRLGISPKTVGHHVGHVYAKIGVSTRAAAALFAVEHGLLER
jgi:HD-GYP domain-containing protein (c-di-GMP phosphodiesterase class II)